MNSTSQLENEALTAVLRYVVVANWFEQRPVTRYEEARDVTAMDVFNDVESELRRAGERLLRRHGNRKGILEQVLQEYGLTIEPPKARSA